MRTLALTAAAIIIGHSVLDPATGVTVLQGMVLFGIAMVSVNLLFPNRGIGIFSLLAIHLITRRNRRKETRHATPHPASVGPRHHSHRRSRDQTGRKAA